MQNREFSRARQFFLKELFCAAQVSIVIFMELYA